MRHRATYYGSQGVALCDKCDTGWPCEYEQGWRAALREAADDLGDWLHHPIDRQQDADAAAKWLRARTDAEEGK